MASLAWSLRVATSSLLFTQIAVVLGSTALGFSGDQCVSQWLRDLWPTPVCLAQLSQMQVDVFTIPGPRMNKTHGAMRKAALSI